jgi:hypothetical protein
VIEEQQPLRTVRDGVAFEFFGESHDPSLSGLLDALDDADAPSFAPPSAAE